jgi:hypothetical protein
LVLWESAPLLPDTCRVNVPSVADEVVVTVRVEVAVDPAGGVTGEGMLTETPDGAVPAQE